MIEKVARALATADGKDPDAPAWICGPETFGLCWRDQYSKPARAALEAIQPEIVKVFEPYLSHEYSIPECVTADCIRVEVKALFDAAMETDHD